MRTTVASACWIAQSSSVFFCATTCGTSGPGSRSFDGHRARAQASAKTRTSATLDCLRGARLTAVWEAAEAAGVQARPASAGMPVRGAS